ncbi:MAG: PD-(D/E)XK nuclease family protein [Thainema sp.]
MSQPLTHLSQGHLNLLEQCPRKFQHTYLDQLRTPPTPEQQQRMEWGQHFHLLMQQRELGLPLDVPAQTEPDLSQAMQALIAAAPDVFTPTPDQFRQSEHRRTLEVQGYLLTVVYDLLLLEPSQAQILDWKTYPRPHNRDRLARDWQTRLYLYVLAETTDLEPEQISMTYWFTRTGQSGGAHSSHQPAYKPQCDRFAYNHTWHEQTRQQLTTLLTRLTQWQQDYQQGIEFPQVSLENGSCDRCSHAIRCYRLDAQPQPFDVAAMSMSLDEIEEVVL